MTGVMAAWAAGFRSALPWLRGRQNRVPAAAILFFVAANTVYAFVRAVFLESSDLIGGFMFPTRGTLLEGKDPFVEYTWNSYSPFFYAAMSPLALLPDGVVSVVWTALTYAFLVGIVALVRDMQANTVPGQPAAPAWLGPLLALALIADNVNLGQSNILPLFFVCACFHACMRGKEWHAGALLSVAIAFKVTPAIFVGWLFLKRKFRALLAVALGLVVWLLGAPALVFGPTRAMTFLQGWLGLVVGPFVTGRKVQSINVEWHHTNQSLDAVLNRFFTPYAVNKYGGLHAVLAPAFFTEDDMRRVALVLKLGILALISLLALRGGARPGRSWVPELAVFLLAALVLSPISWFSHFVSALVAYMVTVEALRDPTMTPGLARMLRWSLGTAVVLAATCWSPVARSWSPIFLGHAWLFGALWLHAWRQAGAKVDAGTPR